MKNNIISKVIIADISYDVVDGFIDYSSAKRSESKQIIH